MATWDTSQFNFMVQTADQMADNRFQRLAQEQAENERRFRRDLAEQEANHRFNMDMNRDQREERKFNQAYEIAAAAENRAAEQFRQNMSDAQAAAEIRAAAERRAQTAWEQSQAAARQQREQEDLTRRYNTAQHSPLAQAYYRLSAGDNFADLPPAQQQALRTGIMTSANGSVGTSDDEVVNYYRSLRPQDLIGFGIIPEYAEEYRRRRAADPHLEQTRANQAAALAAQRQQLADAELARRFAGLTPEQRIAAYLRAGLKYKDLPENDQRFLFDKVTGGGNEWSNASIHSWLTSQPRLADQDNLSNFILRQHSGNTGTYTYTSQTQPSGQRPAPAASAASGQRPAPDSPAPLNADQQQALLAFEYLSRKGGEVSAADPFKGLDVTQKDAFIRVFGNGAENLTAAQVREILANPYAFSRFGFDYNTPEAKKRLLAAVPQILAQRKQNQPAPAPGTAETRFQHLSNNQRLALMAFMAMRENEVSFESLPQDWKDAFNRVFMPDGQQRFKLQTGQGKNNLKSGETATEQGTATPEDIAASGDLSAIFGLQTTDQARENEIFARGKYNAPETTQARLTNFVNEMDGDTRLAYEAFAAIHSGVKLSDLPEKMRSAFFRQFNNGNRFTTDEAANTFVKDLGNLGRHFHTSQERNAFLQLMKQGYQSRKDATSQAEQAQREAETQRYRHEAELVLRNANPSSVVIDNDGRPTVIGGKDPSKEQVDALADIMQQYGLPGDQALAISQDNQKLGLLRSMPAALYRSAVTKFGRDFTGLDFAQQAGLLAAYQEILSEYMRDIGNAGSGSLTPDQTAKIQQLTHRWKSKIDRLSIDSAVANRIKSKSPFSAVPRFTFTPSAQ
jgi:hypothetical protein